jgi:hypothetical protein
MALPTLSGLTTSVYGSNSSNAQGAIPSLLTADVGQTIGQTQITAIAQAACDERVRRGSSTITIPAGYYAGLISASRLQDIRTVVEVAGPAASQAYNGAWQGYNSSNGQYGPTGYAPNYDNYGNIVSYTPTYSFLPAPETITYGQAAAETNSTSFSALVGSRIRATHINSLITEINSARAACTCNCNYCTCNCNYCTCNCNYSCTCNCNYSDEQLKTQIEYM